MDDQLNPMDFKYELPNELPPDPARRFGGIARLYGDAALARFAAAHVCVIGLGGVGSWTVEALARSAIGRLTLIDLDHVAESNINRQIHAVDGSLGKSKALAMTERIAGINPSCVVRPIEEFAEPGNLDQLIGGQGFDMVIDAIDNVKSKVALAVYCREHDIPLLMVGSAGGQTDPTRVRIADLALTEHEPLLARVRKRLRSQHGFPRNLKTKFGIDAVYSDEPLRYPDKVACATDGEGRAGADDGEDATAQSATGITGLNCAGFGSSVAVTAVFGMIAAGHVLNRLAAPL